jgi:TPR repeat protein
MVVPFPKRVQQPPRAAFSFLIPLVLCVASTAVTAVTAGCNERGESSARSEPAPVSSEKPSAVIGAAMGGCDDVARCASDCDGGSGESCRRLAVTYEFGTSDAGKNETTGTAFFDRSCALGSASGCVSSGQMHEYGHGVPKDPTFAANAYERACTLGWQVGCANWAIMLENGRGVPRDEAKAKSLYDGACKAGAGLACERLKVLSAKP